MADSIILKIRQFSSYINRALSFDMIENALTDEDAKYNWEYATNHERKVVWECLKNVFKNDGITCDQLNYFVKMMPRHNY